MNDLKRLSAIVHINGEFVAQSTEGKVTKSSDAISWDNGTSSKSEVLHRALVWDGNKYVSMGYGDWTLMSSDRTASNWNLVTRNGTNLVLSDISWNGSKLLAVGNNGLVISSGETGNACPGSSNWNPVKLKCVSNSA